MFVNLVYNKYIVFNFLGIQIIMHMRNKFQQFLKSVSVGNNNSKLMWSPAFIVRVSIWKTKPLCFTNEQSHFHQIECYHHNNMGDKLFHNFGAKFQHLWLFYNFTLKIMFPWQLFLQYQYKTQKQKNPCLRSIICHQWFNYLIKWYTHKIIL